MSFLSDIEDQLREKILLRLKDRANPDVERIWLSPGLYNPPVDFDHSLTTGEIKTFRLVNQTQSFNLLKLDEEGVAGVVDDFCDRIEKEIIQVIDSTERGVKVSYTEHPFDLEVQYWVVVMYFHFSLLEW